MERRSPFHLIFAAFLPRAAPSFLPYRIERERTSSRRYHADGSEYSFSFPLNDGYEGGGTAFEYLGDEAIRPTVGDALVHPGHLRHAGAPVTSGVRYVMVGFLKHDPGARRYAAGPA